MKTTRIIIVGAGFGGVYTFKKLHKFFHNNPRVELSIIAEKSYFLFSPLLHEVATGSISPENIVEPIRSMFRCCLRDLHLGKAERVNIKDHTVKVGDKLIPYDYLILAPGAETNYYNIPGAQEYSFSLKSLEDAIVIKNHIIGQVEKASHVTESETRKNMLRFVIVGGGPTGVEFAAELQEFLTETFVKFYPKEVINDASVVLIQKAPELLMQMGEKLRKKSFRLLQKKGVEVILNADVTEVTKISITIDKEKILSTESVVWVGGVKPALIQFDEDVTHTPDGRIVVNEYLQVGGMTNVFALGDVAAHRPNDWGAFLPALAQVAVGEALSVAENLRLVIEHKQFKKFHYYHKGDLISLGQWMALGQIKGASFSGGFTWLLWRTVYLFKLVSWRKKMNVALDWVINFFSPRDISKL
ncbi:MAG: NAD(P)/FAD-dependent oxidoreductase [Patescibacteria group bacterium]